MNHPLPAQSVSEILADKVSRLTPESIPAAVRAVEAVDA